MTSKVLYPSLTHGWANNTLSVADNLLTCFILSDYSQTYLYKGMVSSLPWIMHEAQDNVSGMLDLITVTLTNYFNRYFNNTEVEVKDVTDPLTPSKGALSIYVKFTDTTNQEFVLGKMLSIIDSKIKEVININNNG
jgi:hypothetical protein